MVLQLIEQHEGTIQMQNVQPTNIPSLPLLKNEADDPLFTGHLIVAEAYLPEDIDNSVFSMTRKND
jgi:hypothetical protein